MGDATPVVPEAPTEVRRSEILEAAAAVFGEKGYERATMKEIAARAGVAPGTIYLYFENKRDLMLAIADSLIARPVDNALAEVLHLGAEAYIAAILRDRVRFARENRAFLQALMTEIWTDAELRTRFFTQIITPLFTTAARYVKLRVAEGALRPCRIEIVVPAIAGSIVIFSALRALFPEGILPGVPDDELVEELTQLYLYGLQARPVGVME